MFMVRLSAQALALGSFGGKPCPQACTSKSPFILWDTISKLGCPCACYRIQGWKGPAGAETPNRDDVNLVPQSKCTQIFTTFSWSQVLPGPRSISLGRLLVPALRSFMPVLLLPPQLSLHFSCFINSGLRHGTGQPGFLILLRRIGA